MVRCSRCDIYFDSDEDPACFVELPEGNAWKVLCDNCREQDGIEDDEAEHERLSEEERSDENDTAE